MSIPLINGMGYDNLHISEIWMCELLKKILPYKPGVFIDVGVNVGQTLMKLRVVDSSKEYIGFEPNPRCVYYSEAVIKENNFKNCKLIPVGLLDKDTVLELNLYSFTDTDQEASLIPGFRPDSRVYSKIYVPVFRFETLSEQLNIGEIGVIKIDVEGAELEVLQSLQNTIREKRPIVLMEILPCYNNENTQRLNRQLQLESILKSSGYRIVRIIKSKDGNSVESFHELKSIGVHSNRDWCEYILIPDGLVIDTINISAENL